MKQNGEGSADVPQIVFEEQGGERHDLTALVGEVRISERLFSSTEVDLRLRDEARYPYRELARVSGRLRVGEQVWHGTAMCIAGHVLFRARDLNAPDVWL